jgi:putative FmdB family regulatory protein
MPTYEYACTLCQHRFEIEQSMKDAAITTCPSCGEEGARRQISGGAAVISGGSRGRASAEDGAALSAKLSRESKATAEKKGIRGL